MHGLPNLKIKSISFGVEICQMNYQAQTYKTFRPGKMTFKYHRHVLVCSLTDNRVVSMVTAIQRTNRTIRNSRSQLEMKLASTAEL